MSGANVSPTGRNKESNTKILKKSINHAHAVAIPFHPDAVLIRNSRPETTYRRTRGNRYVAMALAHAPCAAAYGNNRQRVRRVRIRVPHAGAVEDERMIQDRSTSVFGRSQFLEKLRKQAGVVDIDLNDGRNLLRIVLVMRHAVMLLGHADLRIGSLAKLSRHHKGE